MGGDCLRQLFSSLSVEEKRKLLEGTQFTKVEDLVSRIPKDINNSLTKEIIEKCRNEGFDFFSTQEFDDKMDFGDFDFYTVDNRDLKPMIIKLFDPLVIHKNGHTTTFSYKFSATQYFQVDFAHITNLKLGKFVKSYADIGMTLGMIASHNKLKFGEEGLFLKLNGNNLNDLSGSSMYNPNEEMCFLLSTDVEAIVNFFGLSYKYWELGFSNMERAYEWLARSRFYSPRYFVSGEQKLKRHNKPKRKFMLGFEEYSQRMIEESFHETPQIDTINYVFKFFKNRDKIIETIVQNLQKKILNNSRNEKFSGKKFLEKGFQGKEIGIQINNFQKHVKETFQIDNFESWLDLSDTEKINQEIELFLSIK